MFFVWGTRLICYSLFMNETKINDIHTFTLGFDNLKEERFNELENAKSLANQLIPFIKSTNAS